MTDQPVQGDFRVKGNVAEFFYQGKWMSCDLRSPYERGGADMLEQVIEWIKECPNYDLETYAGLDRMIQDLKATMRPQENS